MGYVINNSKNGRVLLWELKIYTKWLKDSTNFVNEWMKYTTCGGKTRKISYPMKKKKKTNLQIFFLLWDQNF